MSANPARAAEPRPPANEEEVRAALAWETGQKAPDDKSTWEWLWEAIQGDFNDNRSTGQIAFDAGIAFIPVIDQICDIRDIIANCRSISQSEESDDNTWKWVALALTLIGLFPSIGSLVKGVLKIFFTFVRKFGFNQLLKGVDNGMTWAITFLRKREVQRYLSRCKVDEVFKWLAIAVRKVQAKANTAALLAAFDKGIGSLKGLLEKVTWIPRVGEKAKQTIAMVEKVRAMAPKPLAKVDEMLQAIFETIAKRLEMEHFLQRGGILNANNVHFRGTLPEAHTVTLMRTTEPPPIWLTKKGKVKWAEQELDDGKRLVETMKKRGWDDLNDKNINSFHTMAAVEIKGPAKLYRVVSPSNGAMGDCWVPEDVVEEGDGLGRPQGSMAQVQRRLAGLEPQWAVCGSQRSSRAVRQGLAWAGIQPGEEDVAGRPP